jgi:hypothetical protein
VGCAHAPRVYSLEEIVFHNAEAEGRGRPAQSLQIELTLKEARSELQATYRVTRNGQMRIDIMAAGHRIYTEAYDGTKGWDMDAHGTATVDPNGAALWHGTQFPGQIFGLDEVVAHGHRLEYVGRERVAGVDYLVLRLTLSDGFETYRYINPSTWLIDRGRDFRAFHPALDAKRGWVETTWADYRPVGGVLRSFLSINTDLETGAWKATNAIRQILVDPPIDRSVFEMPSHTTRDPSASARNDVDGRVDAVHGRPSAGSKDERREVQRPGVE